MNARKRSLPTVWLEKIEIDGFRSCRKTEFSPNSELSVLIGLNGAGKTNLLQAIRLLDNRSGRGLKRLGDVDAQDGRSKITAWFKVDESRIGLRILFSPDESNRRGDELVATQELWNLASITKSRAWIPLPTALILHGAEFGRHQGGQIFLFEHEYRHMVANRRLPETFDTSLLLNEKLADVLHAIENFRTGISYYSASQFTDPSRCPGSFEVDEEGRLVDAYRNVGGHVHLRFLHDLYQLRNENEAVYTEYCRFVSKQQLGLVSRITWKEVDLSSSTAEVRNGGSIKKIKKKKKLVIPKVQIGSSHITFNQLSEGTFKTLALAFYVITDASKFLMIEEPEVCVHHGLLRRVVETIKSYSSRKQTIVSTHSDLLVDEIEPKDIFVVEMTTAGSEVNSLKTWLGDQGGEALHAYLAECGSLGDYWKSGGFSK